MILASETENGQVFHVNVIPSNQTTTAQLLIPQGNDQLGNWIYHNLDLGL